MKASPSHCQLRLELFRVDKIAFEFRPEFLDEDGYDGDQEDDYSLTVDFDWQPKHADAKQFIVNLSVRCRRRDEARLARFAYIQSDVAGVFVMDDTASVELRRLLVPHNCLAILHGLMRGIVASATGSCVHGPYMLPVLNYKELVDGKLRILRRKLKADIAKMEAQEA